MNSFMKMGLVAAILLFLAGVVALLAKVLRVRPAPPAEDSLGKELPWALLVVFVWAGLSMAFVGTLLRFKTSYFSSFGDVDSYGWGWLAFNSILAVVLLGPMAAHIGKRRLGRAALCLSPPYLSRGLLIGIVVGTLWVLINTFDLRFFRGLAARSAFALRASIYFCIVALSEELLFRGYLQRIAVARLGAVKGIVVSALAFALAHFVKAGLFSSQATAAPLEALILTMVVGLYLGYAAYRTGNIAAPIVIHLFVDLAGHID